MKFGRADYDAGRAKIEKDEPVFLIRGKDKFAGDTVRFYANLIESSGAPTDVVASARAQAAAMDAWPKNEVPDVTKREPIRVPPKLQKLHPDIKLEPAPYKPE